MLVLGINRILKWVQITTGWGTYTCPTKEINGELFFKLPQAGVMLAAQQREGEVFGPAFFCTDEFDQIESGRDQTGQFELRRTRRWRHGRLQALAIVREHSRVDLVGLAEQSTRAGVIADLARVDQT